MSLGAQKKRTKNQNESGLALFALTNWLRPDVHLLGERLWPLLGALLQSSLSPIAFWCDLEEGHDKKADDIDQHTGTLDADICLLPVWHNVALPIGESSGFKLEPVRFCADEDDPNAAAKLWVENYHKQKGTGGSATKATKEAQVTAVSRAIRQATIWGEWVE